MNSTTNLTLSASPRTKPARKTRRFASLALQRRSLYGRTLRCNAGKELDNETGLYYYGARYLDPKTGRWLSGDPAVGEYIPSAPVNDEAKKRNGSLPGMGGVFNYANLHVYQYSFNNPITYIDPDGRSGNSFLNKLNDIVNSVKQYTSENKEALLIIAFGGVQIAAGNMLKGTGIGGGILITGASYGSLTPTGVAVAVAGISAGEVLEVTGTLTVTAGLAMLASNSNNGTGGGSRSNPQNQGNPNQTLVERNPNDTVRRVTQYDENGNILREIRPEGSHGIKGPTVKEPTFNTNPNTGQTFQNGWNYRPATDAEINLLR